MYSTITQLFLNVYSDIWRGGGGVEAPAEEGFSFPYHIVVTSRERDVHPESNCRGTIARVRRHSRGYKRARPFAASVRYTRGPAVLKPWYSIQRL